ncbi:MAG: electron transport complex subunit E [Bacilli bacterium]|jgi:electron transport complex protein RnfE|nr:electron transport complex subunit E [Bacilli bacterium]
MANKTSLKTEFTKGLFKENPILVTMLGLCPTLAITVSLENALGMGIAFAFVLLMSNIVVSLIRKIVPSEIRIPVYIVIIATFVSIVEMLMAAYLPSLSDSLGVFIPLIVVNCIVLGRAEAFASKNGVLPSIMDALGMAVGYTMILALIASIREILGSGTLTIWGSLVLDINKLFGSNETLPIFSSFFISPAGAYLVLGIIFGVVATIRISKERKQKMLEKKAEEEKKAKLLQEKNNQQLNLNKGAGE